MGVTVVHASNQIYIQSIIRVHQQDFRISHTSTALLICDSEGLGVTDKVSKCILSHLVAIELPDD